MTYREMNPANSQEAKFGIVRDTAIDNEYRLSSGCLCLELKESSKADTCVEESFVYDGI